ncbi:MAG: pilus assembly protein [Rhodobacter sp.]|nr:pilus assembly protein [Rhodobacter sp.]
MIAAGFISRARARLDAMMRNEDGGTLVEFGVVLSIFLLLVFGLIDFSRMGFSYVMAGKAADRAVRLAVVRPPACDGLPESNDRGALEGGSELYKFGASCSIDSALCADPGPVSCSADSANATATDIWADVQSLMPSNATAANLLFTYEFTPDMGFLGGPYTPVVTVEIQNLNFEFVTPLGALAALTGATGQQGLGSDFAFPSMSASLPGEALFDGVNS